MLLPSWLAFRGDLRTLERPLPRPRLFLLCAEAGIVPCFCAWWGVSSAGVAQGDLVVLYMWWLWVNVVVCYVRRGWLASFSWSVVGLCTRRQTEQRSNHYI